MAETPILIGLDGGGTSSRAALRLGSGKRVDVIGGPANVSDFAGAMARIAHLLSHLAEAAGLPEAALRRAVAHVGLAGVMDGAMADRVAARLPFARVTVTDDQPTTIAGALGPDDGAVAAIGTGSFIGRQTGGRIRSVGGWGFALGDQSSGAWLGRRLLTETLLAHDGIAPSSDLTRATLKRFGGAAGITAFGLNASPADHAALAPDIVAAASAGDTVAGRLMGEGAAYIDSATTVLGHGEGEPLCLVGGLGPAYGPWLLSTHAARIIPPKGSALDGALALADRLAVMKEPR
ncbi:BadF/BadG/BcrA/BcrD ATPase family protein [Defluviimonas sp. D31]|uniref:BadF/BadG/BcrA/BcrD ATPase family protein n=1 Tax=Defluviimonas sp. D31 TaxID=3083253 RepID=UPI00296EF57E|nr:BadF/BadG/BcrA/BcrD ATPase family protein [Defluviimonas sp. D31]MDW4547752.1 BadF/BadG/BcrA/BcrD ATPase family protein [Defluviimonas sp. D31]